MRMAHVERREAQPSTGIRLQSESMKAQAHTHSQTHSPAEIKRIDHNTQCWETMWEHRETDTPKKKKTQNDTIKYSTSKPMNYSPV